MTDKDPEVVENFLYNTALGKRLPRFPDYEVMVLEDERGNNTYGVVNRTSGVVEQSVLMLPQAVRICMELQAYLDVTCDKEFMQTEAELSKDSFWNIAGQKPTKH